MPNVLTDREQCLRSCRATGCGRDPHVEPGEARQCEHGRWWVATSRYAEDRYFRSFQVWRPATWSERRRARRALR